tara:strand:+ start:1552 stop:2412 length:861 start_codon:yes stop_codon:yes gene_type:complete
MVSNKNEKEIKVEVHGIYGQGPLVSILLKAEGISQFIENYRADKRDIEDEYSTILEKANGCPKSSQENWRDNCDGNHPVWSTMAVLKRGALKEPKQSGAEAGQKRDPSLDWNYRWEVARFIDGPSPKAVSTNGVDVVQAKLDDGVLFMLQKEMISNDRTALMQAVAFGSTEGSNILTDDEVVRLTKMWGDLLNERALSRILKENNTSTPDEPKNGSNEPSKSTNDTTGVHNIEDVKNNLSKKGVSNSEVSRILKESNFENGGAWLKANGDNYQGLLDFIEKGINQW